VAPKPFPGLGAEPIHEEPVLRVNLSAATAMVTPMPKAQMRVPSPIINPIEPIDSASTAINAKMYGIPMVAVKKCMVPVKPYPPNQPSSFCAPCGNITKPKAMRSTVLEYSSYVAKILFNMFVTSVV
jgi:hypothetical protein